MQRRVEQAWRMRWSWLLSCAAAKAVAASLLEMQSALVGHLQWGMRWKGTSVMPALPRKQAKRTRTVFHFIRAKEKSVVPRSNDKARDIVQEKRG